MKRDSIVHGFHETPNMYPDLNTVPLSDQQQFRLNKINEMKDYFIAEIKERELMSKRLSKYNVSFDYFDKSLVVLSVTTGSIAIISLATVIGGPAGMVSASFSFAFLVSIGIIKKLLKTTGNKLKKHKNIVMLARSKLNSIENKISQALINNEVSYEDVMVIINKEKKYRELKDSIGKMSSQRNNVENINLIEEGKR